MDQMKDLNPRQREAVTSTEGPLLIIAGAGTGKTGVLTRRIAYLVEEKKVGPESILALTFTEKAAAEMKSRVRDLVGTPIDTMQISTFHSFCRKILIEEGHRLGFPREFHQLDGIDQWVVLRRLLPTLSLDYFLDFTDIPSAIKDFQVFVNRAKDELVSPSEFLVFAEGKREEFEVEHGLKLESVSPFLKKHRYIASRPNFASAWTQEQWLSFKESGLELKKLLEIGEIYRRYQEELDQKKKVDYGDLIVLSHRLLKESEEVREHYQNRFLYILVDEFQDTNIAQLELLQILAEKNQNLCVVGDDDQAIYRFRGASFASFVDFKNAYPSAKVIKLTQNYRSTRNILAAAGTVIAKNAGARYEAEKNLWTERDQGEKVTVLSLQEFNDEARAVADVIESEVASVPEEQRDYSRFAILYRAHLHRELVVDELHRREIPYTIVSPEGILSTIEIRELVSYLQAVRNFKIGAGQETAPLIHILHDPTWGLESGDIVVLFSSRKDGVTLYNLVKTPAEVSGLRREAADGIEKMMRMIDGLVALVDGKSVMEVVQELITRSRFNITELENLRTPESQNTIALVAEFLRFVEEKSQIEENKTFLSFLEYLDYYIEGGGTIEPQNLEPLRTENAVQCMTVHAAKGLEFDTVFVIGLTSRRFPTSRKEEAVSFPRELIKGVVPEGDLHLQEERRLFYVAMTRAKRVLYLSAREKKRSPKSVFIDDLGSKDSDYLSTRLIEHVEIPVETVDERERTLVGQKHRQYTLFPMPERLRLSYSQVDTYRTCGLKYKFAYVYRIPTAPKGYYTYGNVQHAVLEEFFDRVKSGEEVSAETLAKLYEKHWRDEGYADTMQIKEFKKRGYEELSEFYERNKDTLRAPLALEEWFSFELGGHTITGRIDRLDALDGDKVEVIDYKTGKPKDQKNADESLQLSIYALAARERFKKEPALLSFYFLTSNEKVSTSRTEEELEETKEEILKVAASIQRGSFLANKAFHCDWCDFKPICPEWNVSGLR